MAIPYGLVWSGTVADIWTVSSLRLTPTSACLAVAPETQPMRMRMLIYQLEDGALKDLTHQFVRTKCQNAHIISHNHVTIYNQYRWLVFLPLLTSGWWFQPLWKRLVSWCYYSQHIEKMFQTTNQISSDYLSYHLPRLPGLSAPAPDSSACPQAPGARRSEWTPEERQLDLCRETTPRWVWRVFMILSLLTIEVPWLLWKLQFKAWLRQGKPQMVRKHWILYEPQLAPGRAFVLRPAASRVPV